MRFFRFLLGLAAIVLLVAVALGYGGPLVYDLDLLAHFRLHFLGLSLLVGLAALAVGARAALWRSLAAAVLATAGLGPLWEGPGPEGSGPPVTVMTANIYFLNDRPDAMREALVAAGADILVTAETSRRTITGTPDLEALYPYRMRRMSKSGNLKLVLWSKFPIIDGEMALVDRSGVPSAMRAVVEIAPGRRLSLIAVHLSHVALGNQQEEIGKIDEIAAGITGPMVVMGDFNATAWSWAVRRIESLTGTRRIGGIFRTWDGVYPTPIVPLPEPFGLPIDHILVSPGIGVAGIDTVEIPGSDHRAVRAVLRIPPPPSAPPRAPVSSAG